ncbi:MAG: signal recognition particle-docking protein FtsY, partial [Pseudomonadota bacterium]
MSFFKKLRDRMFKSSSKLDEGLDAIIEEGIEEAIEERADAAHEQAADPAVSEDEAEPDVGAVAEPAPVPDPTPE